MSIKNENETEPEMAFDRLLGVREQTGRVQLILVFHEIIDISFRKIQNYCEKATHFHPSLIHQFPLSKKKDSNIKDSNKFEFKHEVFETSIVQ